VNKPPSRRCSDEAPTATPSRRLLVGGATIAALAAVADAGAASDANGAPPPTPEQGDLAAAVAHAVSTAGVVRLGPGRYRVDVDSTFDRPVDVAFGAVLEVGAGVTVRFQAGLQAGLWQIFEIAPSGKVAIDPRFLADGFPEWWGARSNDESADCRTSIQACLDACVRTQLQAADYFISGTVKITRHGHSLIGTSADQNGNRHGSRLVLTNGSADGLQVGYDEQPRDSKHWLEHAAVRNVTILRSVRLQNPPEGFSRSPAGVRLQWAVTCELERVEVIEHSHGFYITGTVHCYIRYCQAFRYKAGASSRNDFFYGFFMDNSVTSGFNSGNASLYIQNCSTFSTQSIRFSESSGIKSHAGYTDTFITGFECALVEYGLDMVGRSAIDADYQSEDLIIETCVIDSPIKAGIRISLSGPITAVQICNCYIAPSGPGSAIEVQDCHGSISISGCQMISTPGNTASGLRAERSSGISAINNIYTDIRNPLLLEDCAECRISDTINNVRQKTEVAAVQARGVKHSLFAPLVRGALGMHPAGVAFVGGTNERNEVNCTGISPDAVAGGSVVVFEGRSVTSTGAFGANLASGLLG
jgi:hypothetical protein